MKRSLRILMIIGGTTLLPLMNAGARPLEQLPPVTAIAPPDQSNAIPLNGDQLAGAKVEQWESFPSGRIVRNVEASNLTPFLPDPAKATGAAVIVAPGGAFVLLSMDNEGFALARWLADHGIAAFVLKYRLQPSPRDPLAFSSGLGKMLAKLAQDHVAPETPSPVLQDAEAAVRLVRARAAQWQIDPTRVGFVGFSAGAITALSVGTIADPRSRPDFIAPIYAPLAARPMPADAPPLFAAIAANDPFFGSSGLGLISEWQHAGRPVELHMFSAGGHGFGMEQRGTTSDDWANEFYLWMKDSGFLQAGATGRKTLVF